MHDDARLLPTQCYVWGKRPTTRGGLWYVTVPAGGGSAGLTSSQSMRSRRCSIMLLLSRGSGRRRAEVVDT